MTSSPISKFTGQGFETYYPGVYTEEQSVGPVASGTPRGVLLAVSATNFTRLKPNTPTLVSSESALRKLLPAWGPRFARLLFRPSTHKDVPGGVSQLYLVNASPSTVAQYALTKSGVEQMRIVSALYGLDANRLWFKLEAGTTKGAKLTLGYEGTTWVRDNLGGDDILGLRYTGSDLSTVTATITPASGVVINYSVNNILTSGGGSSWTAVADLKTDGPATLTLDADNGAALTFRITGVDKATGESTTEDVEIASGETTATSTKSWASIATIALVTGSWGTAANVDLSGKAFDLPIATYDTLQKVIDAVNAASGKHFGAQDAFGGAPSRLVATMDAASGTNIKGASYVAFKADLDAIVSAIGDNEADPKVEQFVPWFRATRTSGATGAPDTYAAQTFLTGAVDGTPSLSTWQAALSASEELDVNELWPETTDSSIQTAVLDHLSRCRGIVNRPRHAHLATVARPSKATAKALVLAAKRYDVQAHVHVTRFLDEDGKPRSFDPVYTALRVAAMYCGTTLPVMPLAAKTLDILDKEDGSDWTERDDGNEMIAAGLVIIKKKPNGAFQIVNDVTTYRDKADPVLTQGSAVRGLTASRIDLDSVVQQFVGSAAFDGTARAIYDVCKARLDLQQAQFRYFKRLVSLTVEVSGVVAIPHVTAEAILPILFVNPQYTWTYSSEIAAG